MMKTFMFMLNQTQPLPQIPSGSGLNMNNFLNHPIRVKEKVVIIIGATGTGKSGLSIDLGTHFPAEIINSDKMQVYQGLDIVTNKISKEEQKGIPHHLLGCSTNPYLDFPPTKFSDMATAAIESILGRDRLPIIVGGSNSYIEALVDDNHLNFGARYEFCFLWLDVAMHVLHSYVSDRVDKMIENGMVEEARKYFNPNADYSRGIRRAIGVPEFDQYFRYEAFVNEETRAKLLQEAITKIKENTCKLACQQWGKIQRLRNIKGWNIHRIDATEVYRSCNGKKADETWNKIVSAPSKRIVREFLSNVTGGEVKVNVKPLRVPLRRSAAIADATH